MSTIAAISTPSGTGALSLIRISGTHTKEVVLAACAELKALPPARRATLVRICAANGEALDSGLLTFFPAPHSFTGEDLAELSCHGGRLVTQHVLERLFACGARPAEPGEFSRRAFENGKMDLTRAEAIMDIISAGSDLALRAAQHQLAGGIETPVQTSIDTLLSTCALLEAHIDFPEDDIPPQSIDSVLADIRNVQNTLTLLLSTATRGRLLREGIRVAIIGAPNAGKSCLLNRLLGYERAIVSEIPGTTRDTVEENILFDGLNLRLIDTAGLRESDDRVERVGMQRTMEALRNADLILEVRDASAPYLPLPQDMVSADGAARLTLLNKSDLPPHSSHAGEQGIRISCLTGAGFEELKQAIVAAFPDSVFDVQSSAVAINARHRLALLHAQEALNRAESSLSQDPPMAELVAADLRDSLDALGSITGRVDTEDILTRVFSTFCIGK